MTARTATAMRVVSSLLGAAFLVTAGVVLYRNAASLAALPATHLGALIGAAVFGAFLIDPAHVGAAIGALIGAARQAKRVKDDDEGGG